MYVVCSTAWGFSTKSGAAEENRRISKLKCSSHLQPDQRVELTLGAGNAGSVATTPLGAAEVGAVVQAVGQRHLGARAADAAHDHGVGAHLPGPVPCLLVGGNGR